ncbi:MAG: Uma2 family endonuclease [Gemmatimonadetes bacterium]|nr:Uma2 family endonuclease [Gemmatimonadota bacterium]
MAAHQLVTAEELERMGHQDFGYELVRGELVPVSPAGDRHGSLAALMAAALIAFVRPRHLGVVHVGAGYILARSPDTVRGPDVAFISRKRLAALGGRRRGFIPGAPDLAVEVRSADKTFAELQAKAAECLQAGTRLVWLVDPPSQAIHIHQPGLVPRALSIGDVLDGADVLPGFTLPLVELFGEE